MLRDREKIRTCWDKLQFDNGKISRIILALIFCINLHNDVSLLVDFHQKAEQLIPNQKREGLSNVFGKLFSNHRND